MRTLVLFLLAGSWTCSSGASDLFWTTWNLGSSDGVYRAGSDGSGVTQIIRESDLTAPDYSYLVSLPTDLAVDPDGSRVFLIETGLDIIWETDLSGSDFTEIHEVAGEDPHQMEVDFANGRIYWVEDNGPTGPARVGRCDLDGGGAVYLIENAGARAGGIAIDPGAGYIFWTETYNALPVTLGVWRCDLDGSNPQAIVSTFDDGTFELGSIATDSEARKVYWIQDHRLIRRVDYDGANDETLYESEALGDRSQLVIDTAADELFWTSLEQKSIWRATLDGSSNAPLIEGLPSSPFAVTLASSGGGVITRPRLVLAGVSAGSLTVIWTHTSGEWVLETSATMAPDSWTLVPADRITIDGSDRTAFVDRSGPRLFLRLRRVAP